MGRGGWYGAVGRPAFFALPPEASHRLATALLSLPLPWGRIGGAVRDTSIEVDLCGIGLSNPIGLAAGFDKTCRHLGALGRLGFGFVVGGTITRAPRVGNPKPRIVRSPRRGAIVNSMGLPNPGADVAAAHLARIRRTAPRFASLKSGFLYRAEYVPSCRCKPDSWDSEARQRHRVYALEAAARKGNPQAKAELAELTAKMKREHAGQGSASVPQAKAPASVADAPPSEAPRPRSKADDTTERMGLGGRREVRERLSPSRARETDWIARALGLR